MVEYDGLEAIAQDRMENDDKRRTGTARRRMEGRTGREEERYGWGITGVGRCELQEGGSNERIANS